MHLRIFLEYGTKQIKYNEKRTLLCFSVLWTFMLAIMLYGQKSGWWVTLKNKLEQLYT